jgi:hypothetical protein
MALSSCDNCHSFLKLLGSVCHRDLGVVMIAASSAFLQCVVPIGQADTPNTPYRGIVTRDGWGSVCLENHSRLQFQFERGSLQGDEPRPVAPLSA